ncbi:hypothetical protein GCM10023080_063600 [Streptomyces pseudoechinosporeus]
MRAGTYSRPLVEQMGAWGVRWMPELRPDEFDPVLLVLDTGGARRGRAGQLRRPGRWRPCALPGRSSTGLLARSGPERAGRRPCREIDRASGFCVDPPASGAMIVAGERSPVIHRGPLASFVQL